MAKEPAALGRAVAFQSSRIEAQGHQKGVANLRPPALRETGDPRAEELPLHGPNPLGFEDRDDREPIQIGESHFPGKPSDLTR